MSKVESPSLNFQKYLSKKELSLSIDQDNEYTLTKEHLFLNSHSVFYDKNKKIAEIINSNNYVSITIFVEEQVNLFFDVSAEFIAIQSGGPLCIDGLIHADKIIKLTAQSVLFADDINSGQLISLEIKTTVVVEKTLTTNQLFIVANEFHNLGNIRVEKFADLAVNQHVQSVTADTQINGTLRLISDTCQLTHLLVKQQCYIKAKKLILGNDDTISSINLQGNIYLEVDDLHVCNGTEWTVDQGLRTKYQNVTVNSIAKLHEKSRVNFNDAKVKIADMYNEGDLQVKNCHVIIERCYQKKLINFNNSRVEINEEFSQENDAITENSGDQESYLSFKRMNIRNGKMKLSNTALWGDQWNVHAGVLEINDSQLNLVKNLYIYDPATFQLTTSMVQVNQNIILNGSLTFNGAVIRCQSMDAQGSSLYQSTIQNSRIGSEKEVIFWKNLLIRQVQIIAYDFTFRGKIQAENITFKIANFVTWEMNSSDAKNVRLSANKINFLGDLDVYKPATFSNSHFVAKSISHRGVSLFLDSEIHANKKNISHGIEGKMQLENSKFYTPSQIFHYQNSEMKVIDRSEIVAGAITNNGKIDTHDSMVLSKIFLQYKGEFKSQHSKIHVEDNVYNIDSKMNFAKKSQFIAVDVLVDGTLSVEEESIAISKNLFSVKESKVGCKQSLIKSGTISFTGSVKIARAALSATQLAIFDEFSAMDGSVLEIEQQMDIALQAVSQNEKSQISSPNINLLGNLTLNHSLVECKEKMDTGSQSELKMQGSSKITGKNVTVRGGLISISETIEEKDPEKSKKLIPQIEISNQLEMGSNCHVSGSDLMTEAKKMVNHGEIHLTDTLVSKGSVLMNQGLLTTGNNLFLGFDDYVINRGVLDGQQVTIHSNLINLLGKIIADETFTNTGFFSLNAGLYCAANINVSSLVSIDGLMLPNFVGGLSNIFNPKNFKRNLKSGAKILLSNVLPKYTNMINLAFMLPDVGVNLYRAVPYLGKKSINVYNDYQSGKLYKNCQKVYNDYISGKLYQDCLMQLPKLRRHELMAMLCQVKNTGMFLYNAATTTQSATPEIYKGYNWWKLNMPTYSTMVSNFEYGKLKKKLMEINNFDHWRIGRKLVGAMGGAYNDESLLHLNIGMSASLNRTNTSLLYCNLGAEFSLQFHSVNSHYLFNAGINYGSDSSFLAREIINYGEMKGFNVLNIISRTVINYGEIQGYKNNIEIDQLEQKNIVDFTDGQLRVKKWREAHSSKTHLENIFAGGDSFRTAGKLKANKVIFDFVESIDAEISAALSLQNFSAKTPVFTCSGTFDYQERIKIESDLFHAKQGSQIHGAVSELTAVERPAETIGEQLDRRHALMIESKETILGGEQSGGDYTSISGDRLTVEKSGKIDLQHGRVNQKITVIQGEVHTQQSVINSTELVNEDTLTGQRNFVKTDLLRQKCVLNLSSGHLSARQFSDEKSSDTTLLQMSVDGDDLNLKGRLKATDTEFQYTNSIVGEASSTLNLQNFSSKTSVFTYAGTLNYQEQVKIESDLFHTKQGSRIQGAVSDLTPVESLAETVGKQVMDKIEEQSTPRHALMIKSKETILGGEQSGGDYTSISGNRLTVEKSGKIDLWNGHVDQKTTVIQGEVQAQRSVINSTELVNENTLIGQQNFVKTDLLRQKHVLNLSSGYLDARQFSDEKSSDTTLLQMSVDGDDLNLKGQLKATDTEFQYTNNIVSEASSTKDCNNVKMKTKNFVGDGDTTYQNLYQIDTESYTTTDQSHLKGMQSSPDSQPKPTHVLTINADEITLGGQQEGGDYTQMIASNSLKVKKKADINIPNGYVKARETEIDDRISLEKTHLDSRKIKVNEQGQLSLFKESSTVAEEMTSAGVTVYDESFVQIDNLSFSQSATEHAKNSTFKTQMFDDSSKFFYQGQVFIDTERYSHHGKVQFNFPAQQDRENSFFLKAKTAELVGSAHIGHGVFNIEGFDKATQFISGSENFLNYHFHDSLDLQVQRSLNFTDKIQRNCDIYATGTEVTLATRYENCHLLSLKSTQGNVIFLENIHAGTVLVDSAADIFTNKKMYADHDIYFTAKGSYYNLGGKLDGEVVTVRAAKIMNVTKDSTVAHDGWRYKINEDGVINGRSKTFLEATADNIENHGGVIRGRDYLQLVASGDILNLCNKKSYQGKYDTITQYDPAIITGGKGSSTDGFGLFVQAGKKVKGHVSNFLAEGNIYIDGVYGVKFEARHDTYISYDKTKRKWYGKKTHRIKTHTDIYHSTVQSTHGRAFIRSDQGRMKSVATIFSSLEGTDVYADKSVQLYSLKTQDKTYHSKEQLWGLTKSSRKEMHESSAPTVFIDNGLTRIHSERSNVIARGAVFLGDGDLFIKAGKRIIFGCDILNHKMTEKSQSFTLSGFGVGAFHALKNQRGVLSAFAAEDTTFAKLNNLLNSENMLEIGVNSSNFAISAFNASNDLMRGIANDNLTNELLSRYSLGDGYSFNPSVNLSFNRSKTTTEFQTLGPGGVDRHHIFLEAEKAIDVSVNIHAQGDMQMRSPEFIATAPELKSKYKSTNQGIRVGVNITGQVTDVGVSYAHQKMRKVTHINPEISAGGHMDLGELDRMSLEGANLIAETLSGHIKTLKIESKQDVTRSTSKQVSASTAGQLSGYASTESSQIVGEASGIYVKKGINHEQETFTVDRYYTKGGKIVTNGQNNFKAQEVISEDLHDSCEQKGLGISGNIHDLERVMGTSKPNNGIGEKAIATMAITVDRQEFKGVQENVVHGSQGTQTGIAQLQGKIHTIDNDGYKTHKDRSIQVTMDVPLANREFITEAQDNFISGLEKITQKTVIPVPEIKLEEGITGKDVSLGPIDIPPATIDATVITEALLSGLQQASSEQQQEMNTILEQVSQELSEEKQVTPETQKKLDSVFTEVLLKTIKAGGEYGQSKLAGIMQNEHSAVKCYMGAKGLMFSFAMNVALKNSNSSNPLKEAAITTTADLFVNFTMERIIGTAASGVMGWAMVGVDVADKLLYSDQGYQQLRDGALPYAKLAFSTDDPHLEQAYFEMVDNRHEVAAAMDLLHKTSQVLEMPSELIKHNLQHGLHAISEIVTDKSLWSDRGYQHLQNGALADVELAYSTDDPHLEQTHFEMAENKHEIAGAMNLLHKTNQVLEISSKLINQGLHKVSEVVEGFLPSKQDAHETLNSIDKTRIPQDHKNEVTTAMLSKNAYTTFNSKLKPISPQGTDTVDNRQGTSPEL